jgi:hypothetical protein
MCTNTGSECVSMEISYQMEVKTLNDEFIKADEKMRMITCGGSVSREDQEEIIGEVITNKLTDKTDADIEESEIRADGPLGIALNDMETTAYFSEAQFRVLQVESQYRYLATTGAANCLTVFAHTPTGSSFGAHLNLVSMFYSLEEAKVYGGGVFQNMVDAMKKAFGCVNNEDISIFIVGGWMKADFGTKRKQAYQRTQERMWSFSGVVLDCLKTSLPGASIDTSNMNLFNGVSWEDRTQKTKLKCIIDGHAFRFVVLDTRTGMVYIQKTNLGDFCFGKGSGVMFPESVMVSSLIDLSEMHERVKKFKDTIYMIDTSKHESVLKGVFG